MAAVQRQLLLRHGPGARRQPAARLPGLVLHRPPPEAHRAQRRGHRRRRPHGQGARHASRTRSASWPTTFNIMADRLRGAFAQVEYERDRVEVLLNDLSEGVIGLSAEGTVTIANPAAAELLDEPVPVGADARRGLPARRRRGLARVAQEDADCRPSCSCTASARSRRPRTRSAAPPTSPPSSCCATSPPRRASSARAATSSPTPRTSSRRRSSRWPGSSSSSTRAT